MRNALGLVSRPVWTTSENLSYAERGVSVQVNTMNLFGKKAKITTDAIAAAPKPNNQQTPPGQGSEEIFVREVFSTSEIPPRTFVDRHGRPDIRRLKTAIEQGGKVVCLYGESKSGKTMFARKQLSESLSGYVLVEGSRIGSLSDFWQQLGETLKIALEKERQVNAVDKKSTTLNSNINASFSTYFASMDAGASAAHARQAIIDTAIRTEPVMSVRSKCIEFLSETKTAVILDDFHLIEDESVRRKIAFDLKTPAGALQGKYIFISIPENSFDFINSDEQLQVRFSILPFPAWTRQELGDIAGKGFDILGFGVSSRQISRIAANATLNPLNLQQICVNICSNVGIARRSDVASGMALSGEHLAAALEDFAEELSFFSQIIDIAAATAGVAETLTTYRVGEARLNIYQLALVALSDSGANENFGVTIAKLRKRIRERVNEESWTNAHLKSALEKLANADLEIKYRRAIPNGSDKPLLISDDKVFVTNPLFRVYLFWCLLPSLGLDNRIPED